MIVVSMCSYQAMVLWICREENEKTLGGMKDVSIG